MTVDPAWHKDQINAYIAEFPVYEQYAGVLSAILAKASKEHAPLAIVQARAKTVSSFAEKAVRKAHKYDNPVEQLTDLCGARLIAHTQDQVDRMCAFLRANFLIDEDNSLDVRTRLQQSEFGYLSVHYIVQLPPGEILGIEVPESIGDRKAEIQVRTVLQHAWADITHDRLYKNDFVAPGHFHRTAARLAATMESADATYQRFTDEIDAYAGDCTAYMTPDEMAGEIATLDLVLANEPKEANRPGIALRIARIAQAARDCEKVAQVLTPFVDVDSVHREAIQLELGRALTRAFRDQPRSESCVRGRELLAGVARPDAPAEDGQDPLYRQANLRRAAALAALADSYARVSGQEFRARDLYRQALTLDADNPYHLAALLEHEVFCTRDREFVVAMRPVLRKAIGACRAHADIGVGLPGAYLTIGRLNLLLENPLASLGAYAKAVAFCRAAGAAHGDEALADEQTFLQRINPGRDLPPEHTWVRLLLQLGQATLGHQGARAELRAAAVRTRDWAGPVLIVAGAASAEQDTGNARACLERALTHLPGTVISGGTVTGVPGLVGEIAAALAGRDARQCHVVGYIAPHLPSHAPRDERYDEIVQTAGASLGPREPLQMWIDLVTGGVDPADVRVLGFGGGEISAFEYRLALALGAKVGVVDCDGRAVADLLAESDWADESNLLALPAEAETVDAFVAHPVSALTEADLDLAAGEAHDRYRADNKHTKTDPSMLDWASLREDLKESNRHQIRHAEHTLRHAGYGVRKAGGEPALVEFSTEDLEAMSRAEHGRWNAERLAAGWRYGSKRDVAAKISPYLVPWSALPDDIREYDRQAVRDLPRVFAKVGLEIYRL